MKSGIYLVVALVLSGIASAQVRIEAEMTQSEQVAAGLDKLSAAQLAYLNDWLSRRQTQQPAQPALISARILGAFEGWDGETRFRLDNGQVWQQRVGGRYRVPARTNPEVEIERSRFGYYLKLVETGRTVGVHRVR